LDTFQLLVCDVALDGDIRQTVHRGIDSPVTYPELLILTYLHGEDSVSNQRVIGEVERDQDDERKRLRRAYGSDGNGRFHVDTVFPGSTFAMPKGSSKHLTFDRSPRGTLKTTEAKEFAKEVAIDSAKRMAGENVEEIDNPFLTVVDDEDPDPELPPVMEEAPAKKTAKKAEPAPAPAAPAVDASIDGQV
jgi:hypothetical protein